MADQMFNPTIVDAMPGFTPGCMLFDDDGKGWVYARAATDIPAHYVAGWQADFSARLINTSRSTTWDRMFYCGFASVAIPSGDYGWFQVYGIGQMQVSANMAAGAFPYTTATAGQVDDSASGHHRIRTCGTLEARGSTAGLVSAIFKFPASDRMV